MMKEMGRLSRELWEKSLTGEVRGRELLKVEERYEQLVHGFDGIYFLG